MNKFRKGTNSLIVAIVIIIASLGGCAVVKVRSVKFDQNCGGHLKRAADANTIETAESELKTALDYLESNGMVNGYTSVLYNTPDEDVTFWYQNLKDSYNGLIALNDSVSELEKSNMLIKLRETLIDHSKDGENITMPDGISRFPNNFEWGLMRLVCFILLSIGALIIYTKF